MPPGKINTVFMQIYTTYFRFPESRLAKMFNGSIPIILDSLKQHYFIDRDGKQFRHVLNYLRTQHLCLPESFRDWTLLMEEAKYYDIPGMVTDLERIMKSKGISSSLNGESSDRPVRVKVEDGIDDYCQCVAVYISPDLGERISLSADRAVLEEVFPELSSALMDSRNSGWNMDNRYVIRFPLNGFCKLNSLQVLQRLLNHGFQIAASTGGGVEGQQFSEYLFYKKLNTGRC